MYNLPFSPLAAKKPPQCEERTFSWSHPLSSSLLLQPIVLYFHPFPKEGRDSFIGTRDLIPLSPGLFCVLGTDLISNPDTQSEKCFPLVVTETGGQARAMESSVYNVQPNNRPIFSMWDAARAPAPVEPPCKLQSAPRLSSSRVSKKIKNK